MARLSRDLVAQRETRLREIFRTSPDMSVTKANELLAAEFGGKKMAPKRAMSLKRSVVASVPPATTETVTE